MATVTAMVMTATATTKNLKEMLFYPTEIEGLILLVPRIFDDERGYFIESFNQKVFNEIVGKEVNFVQDNQSVSKTGVLRGLHFQKPPFAQGKLVRVSKGSALDVAVDLRANSSTYGKHISVHLTAENCHQLWIPEGFAHGFLALEEDTVFQYKCTNYYDPQSESTLAWNDPDIGIDWQIDSPLLSPKDLNCEAFSLFNTPF